MKILAIATEIAGSKQEDFNPYLRAEALRVWELQQQDIVREIYFDAIGPRAILMLECASVEDAEQVLKTLPLVQHGLLTLELIPLTPYPGFQRLFSK